MCVPARQWSLIQASGSSTPRRNLKARNTLPCVYPLSPRRWFIEIRESSEKNGEEKDRNLSRGSEGVPTSLLGLFSPTTLRSLAIRRNSCTFRTTYLIFVTYS